MKKVLIFLVCVGWMSCYSSLESPNVVGYSKQTIHKGEQDVLIPFCNFGSERNFTVGSLLKIAIEGDEISFGSFHALAKMINGRLHWIGADGILDGKVLPDAGTKISYKRVSDKTTELEFSGEAVGLNVVDEAKLPPNTPPPKIIEKSEKKPDIFLADILSYSTVQIVNLVNHRPTVRGTGFFFTFRMKNAQTVMPAIVSNRHVAEGASETVFRFTTDKEGRPDKIIGYRTEYRNTQWIFHPSNGVDLAVLPLLPIMNELRDGQKIEIYQYPLGCELIPDEDYFSGITQMDDVYMVGYPDGICDHVNNQPIFRKGAIATRPSKNYLGEHAFLIDMAVYNGSSGSPILLATELPHIDRRHKRMEYKGRLNLIGVVYATYKHNEIGKLVSCPIAEMSTQTNKVPFVQVPNNIGIVIHASRLREMENYLRQRYGDH